MEKAKENVRGMFVRGINLRTSAVAEALADKAAGHTAIPLRDHAAGEAEVSAQEPTVVARFYSQILLQR